MKLRWLRMNKIGVGIAVVALISIIASYIIDNPFLDILSTLLLMTLFTVSAIDARRNNKKGAFIFYAVIALLGVVVLGFEISAL